MSGSAGTTIQGSYMVRGSANPDDLAPVMRKHPELLGIGLDQSTSITVHGDTLTCNGPRRAAIWDGKEYYFLRVGDSRDLGTHVATFAPDAGLRDKRDKKHWMGEIDARIKNSNRSASPSGFSAAHPMLVTADFAVSLVPATAPAEIAARMASVTISGVIAVAIVP
jgi:hypothetical protein